MELATSLDFEVVAEGVEDAAARHRPEPEVIRRLVEEGAGLLAVDHIHAQGDGTFIWPTIYADRSGYWFTANRTDPNQGGSAHLHPGVDLRTGLGDPIAAAQRGTVIGRAFSAIGYGNYLMLDHGNGQVTLYGHLSEWLVDCGQVVEQGELIGLGGSTGNSTGPHLHFELGVNGGRLNPCDVLPGAAETNCFGDP